MPWDSNIPLLIWFLITALLTAWLFLIPPDKKLLAMLAWLDYTLIQLFFFWSINWALANYYLRFLAIILSLLTAWWSWRSLRRHDWLPGKSWLEWAGLALAVVCLAGVGYLDWRVVQSYNYKSYPGQPMLAMFPLHNGMYVVANGGNGVEGWGMNNHLRGWFGGEAPAAAHMAYGVDIFEMRIRGYLGKTMFPKAFMDYEGFMDIVYSPCVGTVVYLEDGHPDVPLYAPLETHLGNYIVIQCQNYYVTLGGLRNGSIMVKVGQSVDMRIMLGNIGNSAAPAIPHLHIHATVGGLTGDPVPMLHEGIFYSVNQFATRNKIFIPQYN